MKLSEFPPRLDGLQIKARSEIIQKYKGGKKREKALEELILASMRDSVYYLKAFARGWPYREDSEFISVAYKALERAAVNYDPHRGTTFMAFAKAFLRGALFREWRKAKRAPAQIDSIDHYTDQPREFEEWLNGDDESKVNFPTPENLQQAPEFDRVNLKEVWERFSPYLSRLSELEQKVLHYRYMKGMKFSEIADLFKHRKQNYQAIHQRAIAKLRLFMGVKVSDE